MVNFEDASEPELTFDRFPIQLVGSGITYIFVDVRNASDFIAQADADKIEGLFLDALNNMTEGVIVYQANGDLPKDCSYLALVKDCHGQPIKDLDELHVMVQRVNPEGVLLLNLQRFLWSGMFTSKDTQISVEKSIYLQGSECTEPIESESESDDDRSLASEETAGELTLQIGGITARTHRALIIRDKNRFTYAFFELRDALKREFTFPDGGDQNCLNRLLKQFEGKPIRDQVIIYLVRPSLPPQGCPRFGFAYSKNIQPIKRLHELIKLTEESVGEEELFFRIHFRYGNRSMAIDCDNGTLTKPKFVKLTGAGNSYLFFDFKNVSFFIEEEEEIFVRALRAKNITEGVIARQEIGASHGCSRLALVKDSHSKPIKDTRELIIMTMEDFSEEPVLHLNLQRFLSSGTFTSEMPISLDKYSFLRSADTPEPSLEGASEPSPEGAQEPSSEGTSEPSSGEGTWV